MDFFPDYHRNLCIDNPPDRKCQSLCQVLPCTAEKTEKLSTKMMTSARLCCAPLSGPQELFPGISLQEFSACSLEEKHLWKPAPGTLELFFCCEGRGTGQVAFSAFPLYPGDLWVLCAPHGTGTVLLQPGSHGIFLQIDPEKAPSCLSSILAGVKVSPSLLYGRFCSAASPCVLHTGTALGQLFCGGCAAAESSRLGCWRVQTLELLLYLSGQTLEHPQFPCTARQELAEQVAEYLHENMECSFSLEQLCTQFRVSGTVLKDSIRRVYGLPLGQFTRMQKMRSAAVLLQNTSLSVTEIAGRVGYDNPSKFSGAFRKVMGLTPREYRAAKGAQTPSPSDRSQKPSDRSGSPSTGMLQ